MYTYNQLYFQHKKLYTKYLKKLIIILNSAHDKQYNRDYWEPIIGIYLRRILVCFLFLKNISGNKNLFKKLNFKEIYFFRNYREFSNLFDFGLSKKVKFFEIKDNRRYQKYEINEKNFILRFTNQFKIIIPNFLIKIGVTKVLFFESYFKKKLKYYFCLRSALSFYPLPNLKLDNYTIEKKKIFENRLNLMSLNKNQIKNDQLLKNILLYMPVNYIENHRLIHDEVKKINLSNAIYTDGNEISLDYIKFYIGQLKLNEKRILVGQHSLRSGLEDFDIFFDYSKSICNNFFTWGWKNKLSFIRKFSSMRIFSSLSKFKKVEKVENKISKICFILCGFSQIGEALYDNFIENKKAESARIKLLKEINNQKKIDILLKPRSGSFLSSENDKFYKKFKILKHKTRMYEIFGKYSLVIFERLSLGIVESIYLNQPTIFYYPKSLYKIKNKKYNDVINLLKKANIFFDDFKKIEKIINTKESISNWWFNKKNIQKRKKILTNYAKCFEFKDLEKLSS